MNKKTDIIAKVIVYILPKVKFLIADQKCKLENRMKMILTDTKEIQKSADAVPYIFSSNIDCKFIND